MPLPICSQSSNNSYSPASVNYRCYNWEPKVPLYLSSLYFYGSPICSHGSLWPTHLFPWFFMADPFVLEVLRVLTAVFCGDQFPLIGNLKFHWTKFSLLWLTHSFPRFFIAYPFAPKVLHGLPICSQSSQSP
jgi:hypothetical protein